MAKVSPLSVLGLMARIIIRCAIFCACLFILYMAATGAWKTGYGIFDFSPMAKSPGEDIIVTVTENMSSRRVGKLLEEKGLIKDANIYWVQSIVYEYDPLPGTYLLNTSEKLDEMMEIMMTPSAESAK